MDCRAFKRQLGALPTREGEVMLLVAQGRSNPAISEELGISRKTVENTIVRANKRFDPRLTRQEFIQHYWRCHRG